MGKKADSHLILYGVILSLLIISGGLYLNYFLLVNCGNRGSFGDMFGAANAAFSGLALAAIVITILLQRAELKNQQAELKLTRDEFRMQNETMKFQRFENTFFNMIELHKNLVERISVEINDVYEETFSGKVLDKTKFSIHSGVDAFEQRYKQLYRDFQELKKENKFDNPTFFKNMKPHISGYGKREFGQYHANLLNILKWIDEIEFPRYKQFPTYKKEHPIKPIWEDINQNQRTKLKYISILRSQLSDYELLWLSYQCLMKESEELKKMVEKYGLLANRNNQLLHSSEPHEQLSYQATHELGMLAPMSKDKKSNPN